MKNIISFTIDNGGSAMRVLPTKRAAGIPIEEAVRSYDNEFYKIPSENIRMKTVEYPKQLITVIDAPIDELKGSYAVGLTGRMFKGNLMPLSPLEKKTQSENFYRQFIFSTAQAIIEDSFYAGIETAEDMSKYEGVEWDCVIATNVPIGEHAADTDLTGQFKLQIAGSYKVGFPLIKGSPVIEFEIKPTNVGVLPEGGVVISSLSKMIKPDYVSLVIDIGHVSTELAVYFGKSLDGHSYYSSSNAGQTLLAVTQAALEEVGYRPNISMVKQCLHTGKIKDGNTEIDVCEIVKAAQVDFVKNYLADDFAKLYQRAKIVPQQIDKVVPVGELMNKVDGLHDMCELICSTQNIKNYDVMLGADDLRYANIAACDKFAQVLMANAYKKLGAAATVE